MTDIISALVQLMEAWPASTSCQQASTGKLSLVQNDPYPHPIIHITSFSFFILFEMAKLPWKNNCFRGLISIFNYLSLIDKK